MTQPLNRHCSSAPGKTAAVIVTFNGARWISACLESLRGEDIDIVIVVDNASRDETRSMVLEACPAAVLIRLDCNRGFGMANNLGIQRALDLGAEYVCLINQDLTMGHGSIAKMVSVLAADSQIGMVSAFQLTYDGHGINPPFIQFMPNRFWDDLLLREVAERYEVEFAPAAAVAISKRVFLDVGGFDPLFFMYGEDDDLCTRLRTRQWKVVMAPEARVRHRDGQMNANRSLGWQCNWEYSRLVLYLKESRRSIMGGLLSGIRYWGFPKSLRLLAARFVAICRCLARARTIASHKAAIPFVFAAGSETDAGDFRDASAVNGENEGIQATARESSPCAT